MRTRSAKCVLGSSFSSRVTFGQFLVSGLCPLPNAMLGWPFGISTWPSYRVTTARTFQKLQLLAELKGLGTKSLQPWMHRACGTLQVTGGKIRSLYAWSVVKFRSKNELCSKTPLANRSWVAKAVAKAAGFESILWVVPSYCKANRNETPSTLIDPLLNSKCESLMWAIPLDIGGRTQFA